MCFLSQTILLLLLFRFLLLLGTLLESFASFANCPAHALGSLRFFGGCGHSVSCGAMMLGYLYNDMRCALLISESAAHRRGTHTLPARTFVHIATRYK